MLKDSRDIIPRLKSDGFELVSVRGSHHKFKHPVSGRIIIVTHPRKDIPPGTAHSIYSQAGWPRTEPMTHYIALIHKEPASGYGVSFPDVLGVTATADTLDSALHEAGIALGFAFEDWQGVHPTPRTLDQLRLDPEFLDWSRDAVIAAVAPVHGLADAA